MTNILYNLQLSAINSDGVFLLSKDSNFRLFIILAKNMEKCFGEKYFFHVPIPKNRDVIDFDIPSNIGFYESEDFITNVFGSRYHWNHLNRIQQFKDTNPDIIWENNPTLINNWKTLLLECKMIDTVKVVGYNHWIDTTDFPKIDERCPYYYRQAEGTELADLFLCNSKEAIRQIGLQTRKTVLKHTYTLAPFIDDEAFNDTKMEKPNDRMRILYNHRLSSFGYYFDAFKLFLSVIENMDFDLPVEIIFTDASGKAGTETNFSIKNAIKRNNISYEIVSKLNNEDYLNLVKSCNVNIGTFLKNNGGCWSMSLAESILAGNYTIIPNHSGYKELVYNRYEFFHDTSVTDIIDKLKKCEKLIKANNYEIPALAKRYYMNMFSGENLAKKLDLLLSGWEF